MKTKKYFLGLLLPEELSEKINNWISRFDPKAKRRPPPHVTLGFNPLNSELVEYLIPKLEELFKEYGPFKLRAVGIDTFVHQNVVIFLRVESKPQLEHLHDEIIGLTGAEKVRPYR